MKRKNLTKSLSFMLSMSMVLSSALPATAYAEGNGTESQDVNMEAEVVPGGAKNAADNGVETEPSEGENESGETNLTEAMMSLILQKMIQKYKNHSLKQRQKSLLNPNLKHWQKQKRLLMQSRKLLRKTTKTLWRMVFMIAGHRILPRKKVEKSVKWQMDTFI